MVHTALEQWMVVEPGKRSTVGFQIADRKTLRRLIESSENCIQEVFVKWPKMVPFDPNKEPTITGFTIESTQGVQRVFQRNSSIFDSYEEAIILQSFKNEKEAGVLHVLGTDLRDPTENKTAWIKSGPLICSQRIVERVE
uniref:Uncharacterized protein n=1 Tax=Panagrolaimus sp. JU765 TaxID=591449 RepID=A0AC34RKZ2_9BILA